MRMRRMRRGMDLSSQSRSSCLAHRLKSHHRTQPFRHCRLAAGALPWPVAGGAGAATGGIVPTCQKPGFFNNTFANLAEVATSGWPVDTTQVGYTLENLSQ
jgi:hypothetical protein